MTLLRAKPVVYPWLLAAALAALLAGSLFRAYVETDVALFRMFGTIAIVLVGFFATRSFYVLQERDALERLEAVLTSLPSRFTVSPAVALEDPGTRRPLVVDLVILGEHSVILVAIDVTRPVASARTARTRLQHLARRLWRARRALEKTPEHRFTAVILSLYRETGPEPTFIEGLRVVAPEGLVDGLQEADAEASGAPLDPALRAALLKRLEPFARH